MATVVGNDGLEGVPSLEDVCILFRTVVNDTFSSGSGQIATDTAPWMKPLLKSALEDLYQDLGLVGDMRVIIDNIIVSDIPALAAGNPATQVALTYQGYFNGSTWNNTWLLPSSLMWLKKLWSRPSGTNGVFCPMYAASDGLEGAYQGQCMTQYEIRGNNELWMNGAMLPTDLRFRFEAVCPDIVSGAVDFTTIYVPIQGSLNALAFKMVAIYAQRLSPDQFSLAESQAAKFTKKLTSKSVLNSQTKEFARIPFAGQS